LKKNVGDSKKGLDDILGDTSHFLDEVKKHVELTPEQKEKLAMNPDIIVSADPPSTTTAGIENSKRITSAKAKMEGILKIEQYAHNSVKRIPAIELQKDASKTVTKKITKDALEVIKTIADTAFE
jgi:hypothetical protein